jgi:hypothetical protein
MTKLDTTKRIHEVRVRGGNTKYRALRLDTGNFAWGSEHVTRKTRLLQVVSVDLPVSLRLWMRVSATVLYPDGEDVNCIKTASDFGSDTMPPTMSFSELKPL